MKAYGLVGNCFQHIKKRYLIMLPYIFCLIFKIIREVHFLKLKTKSFTEKELKKNVSLENAKIESLGL